MMVKSKLVYYDGFWFEPDAPIWYEASGEPRWVEAKHAIMLKEKQEAKDRKNNEKTKNRNPT